MARQRELNHTRPLQLGPRDRLHQAAGIPASRAVPPWGATYERWVPGLRLSRMLSRASRNMLTMIRPGTSRRRRSPRRPHGAHIRVTYQISTRREQRSPPCSGGVPNRTMNQPGFRGHGETSARSRYRQRSPDHGRTQSSHHHSHDTPRWSNPGAKDPARLK